MGTETKYFFVTHSKLLYMNVKLNNPLMGTETQRRPKNNYRNYGKKLN